ncbi:MAG: acyloxyacyl hydrolase [Candidatus Sulfotelmatobacter sp.]
MEKLFLPCPPAYVKSLIDLPGFRGMLGVILLLCSCRTVAQDVPPAGQQGRWDFSIGAAGETGEENTNSFAEAQIWSVGVSVGHVITSERGCGWRRGNLEYAFDFMPVFETFGNQRTHGRGFDPVILRWNSALHTHRISPYIDLAGGAVTTSSNLPPGNTSSFNFMAKGGGGIYLVTRERQSFDIGFRWSHISNANLGLDNPEFNGVQLSLAYHWFK